MQALLFVVGIIALGSIGFLWFHPIGCMFRVTMSGLIRQLYFYWHPNKQAMPTSLKEARARSKQETGSRK